MKSKISIIAAIGKNRELGKDNKLLWNIPEDLKRFREITKGHPIIMGRKTFESIGRILPKRLNIVITRNQESRIKNQENLVFVDSLDQAIEVSKKYLVSSIRYKKKENILNTKYKIPDTDENEVFIIGGGQIFEQAIGIADRLYLTIVDKEYPGADTFFPGYGQFKKEIFSKSAASGSLKYRFVNLER